MCKRRVFFPERCMRISTTTATSCEDPVENIADDNRLQYCPACNGESISTVIYTKNTTVDNLNMYVYLHNNEHNTEKRSATN